MQRRLAILVTMLLVLASAAHANDSERQALLLDEVLRLSYEGVPDQIILKHIETMDFVFELTADDIIELRSLGVSDEVIEALLETALDAYDNDRRVRYVRLSAGFYSPWYHFPYAWGYYYDPFPSYYSFYYYPFRYRAHYGYGYYGWCPTTYYYAYHRGRGYHRGGHHNRSPYHVASHRQARRVVQPASNHVRSTARVEERPTRTRQRALTERSGGKRIRRATEPYRAKEVEAPARVRRPDVRPKRIRDAKAPVSVHKRPAAPQRVERPTTVRRREARTRTSPVRVEKRPARRVARPRATTPRRVEEATAPVRVKQPSRREPRRAVSRPAPRKESRSITRPAPRKSVRSTAPARPRSLTTPRPAPRSAPKSSGRRLRKP